MSIFRKLGLASVLLTLVVAGIVSCGGGTNNDQGTSFSADGFKTEAGSAVTEALTVAVNTDAPGDDGLAYQSGRICMTISNHLCAQSIRINRIDCDYSIQGADAGFNVPSSALNSSYVLSATGGCSFDQAASSSSSSSAATSGTTSIDRCFDILPADQLSYLMVNQNQLPAFPYVIDTICRAVGVTQAGDVLITNDLYFEIKAVDRAECCTGEGVIPGDGGYQTETGTGGSQLVTDSSSSSSSAASE